MTEISNRPIILIVDDVPDNVKLLWAILKDKYEVIAATHGAEALERAFSTRVDLILLDVKMPEMDGYEVCRHLKENENTESIPVVFVTAQSGREDLLMGLKLGAYYYLTKPVDPATLLTVVESALKRDRLNKEIQEEAKNTTHTLGLLEECRFCFRTLKEAHDLAVFLAKACPKPEIVVVGLRELLFNAIEHGNLEISYAEKSLLNKNGEWFQEVERRLTLPEFRDKSVTIRFLRESHQICFHVRDQGKGFQWQSYMEFSHERVFDSHGRGIAMAKALSFDEVQYQGAGNEVMAILKI